MSCYEALGLGIIAQSLQAFHVTKTFMTHKSMQTYDVKVPGVSNGLLSAISLVYEPNIFGNNVPSFRRLE